MSATAKAPVPAPTPGLVPAHLPDAVWTGPVHQVAPGRVLLSIPGLARVLVSAEREPVVEADSGTDPRDLQWLLDRPAREARDLLAGRLALRAATVVIDGRAVALIGHGACGKSIVAAALAARGHGVLSDHRLVLDVGTGAHAYPTDARLDLWPDAAEMLGLPADEGSVVRPALAKRAYQYPAAEAAPLALVVEFDHGADVGEPKHRPLLGGEAIARLHTATAGRPLLEPLGLRPAHFLWMVQIAKAAEVVRLEVDRDRQDPGKVADAVEELAL